MSLPTFALAVAATSLVASAAVAADTPPAFLQCTLVADLASAEVIVSDGTCDQRFSPMSTFKVPLAVIGFDAGILKDAHDPVWPIMPEYDPSEREMAFPEVDPASWEENSIVWYSQHLTTLLGEGEFARYVTALDYGNADVSGGLTEAWLMSSLEISPEEQVAFLRRLLNRELPVSAAATGRAEKIIPTFEAGDWKVQGKTGSGWLRDAEGEVDESRPLGWFVGWAGKDGRRVVFARLFIGDGKSDTYASFIARDALLEDLPTLLAD
jgi:beta-lactamase class D